MEEGNPTLSTRLHKHGESLQLLRHMQAEAEAWQADSGTPLHQPWPAEAQTLAYQALTRLGRTWDNETDPFRIARYPVTWRQFQAPLDADDG